ncbi:MAG TPA: TolC family protein, partial [Ignavibacteriaceae bacterium]|nr:TolC family protein [Ignavibacteriaceae bacterium]
NQDSINYSFAYQTALSNRPEIISDKYKISASQSLLTSAWTANLPTINATSGYNWRSYTIDQQYLYSWNVGVTFSLPIFQGFALDAGIEQAKANMETAQATSDATIQSVNLDVQQQYSNLEQAKEQIDATKTFVRQAQETLKIAEARYREGVGSPIEITDARVTMANASASYIQSLYSYQVTFARLKRAMGVLR